MIAHDLNLGTRGSAGLAATAEVMQLNATLTHLAAQRGALVAAAAAPQFTALVDQLQARGTMVCCPRPPPNCRQGTLHVAST